MFTKTSSNIVALYANKAWRPKLLAIISKVLNYVHIKEEQIAGIIEKNNKQTDKHILNALRKLAKTPVEPYNQKANISRAFRKWNILKPHLHTRVQGVLDFGGNIGDAAYVYGRMITKTPKEKTFVVDIDEWAGEKWAPRDDITFVHFDKMSSIKNEKVDLITISHVLHHINSDYYPEILALFNSMLSANGTIMLYEHDCAHDNWSALIDLEHCLFDVVVSQKLTYDKFIKGFYAKYLSIKKWEKLFGEYFKVQSLKKLNNTDNSFYMFLSHK